jgi:hypothetical protein
MTPKLSLKHPKLMNSFTMPLSPVLGWTLSMSVCSSSLFSHRNCHILLIKKGMPGPRDMRMAAYAEAIVSQPQYAEVPVILYL